MSAMSVALTVVALVAVGTAVSVLARRVNVPAPLLLVAIGIGASYLPFVPAIELTPELVLLGLLPPLLYSAAIRTPLTDLRANRRVIGLLAVGLVLFTTLVVGLVTWWILPVPFAAALAFGAVVAPPDAVAATAVARRIGLPRRIVTVLEGESLLNDATALVALRTAIAAVGGTVSVWSSGLDFAWAAAGGVLIGLVIAALVAFVRRRIQDSVVDTAVSLLAPFLAYLPAEEVHASGVLAVVTTGLVLGHKAPVLQNATSRMNERINWSTIEFLLENAVFLLIGLQVHAIADGLRESDLSPLVIVGFCLAALVAVIVSRPLWVFPVRYLLLRPRMADGTAVPWANTAIVAWAGMRGVVTLAAAFVLPKTLPEVQVLILGAFVVTAGTLLLQGLSLPWLARRLRVRGPDPRQDALAEADITAAATTAGLAELDRLARDEDDPELLAKLRRRSEARANGVWERLGRPEAGETPSEAHRRLRLGMLAAERAAVLKIRDTGGVDSEVLSSVLADLDVEESMIEQATERAPSWADKPLTTPVRTTSSCAELDAAGDWAEPQTTQGCVDCLVEGTRWVHLRLCLQCGFVGCCDSSVGRHAERHFHRTGHPVIRSFEPGEAWRWCYVHDLLG